MADITMCNDGGCPHARICFRHNADPGPLQSWFAESPRNGDECPMFIEPRGIPCLNVEPDGAGGYRRIEAPSEVHSK